MVMMAMPAVFGPVAAVLTAMAAVLGGLLFARERVNVEPYDDTEERIADLTTKVRRRARLRGWLRG